MTAISFGPAFFVAAPAAAGILAAVVETVAALLPPRTPWREWRAQVAERAVGWALGALLFNGWIVASVWLATVLVGEWP
jgi:hypothetical protein